MTRDHLLGYAPAAAVSADGPTHYDEMSIFDHVPFGLGRPQRLHIEQRKRLDAIGRKKQPLRDFEQLPHPNPDGSFTTHRGLQHIVATQGSAPEPLSKGDVLNAMEKLWREAVENDIRTRGTQPPWMPVSGGLDALVNDDRLPQAFTYSESAVIAEEAWRHLPARQAIPISALVPPGTVIGGREVMRFAANPGGGGIGTAQIAEACARPAPLLAATKRADEPLSEPIPGGALAKVINAMQTDEAFRNRMTRRVQEINADLAKQRPSKGDGGIAINELTATQALRMQQASIPIAMQTYDSGFDFPPNA